MKDNDCPRPPKELVINEVGGVFRDSIYVELIGPPLAPLHGLVIVLYELSTARHVIPLEGSLGSDGFFLLGNKSRAGELGFFFFPALHPGYVIVFRLPCKQPPPPQDSSG